MKVIEKPFIPKFLKTLQQNLTLKYPNQTSKMSLGLLGINSQMPKAFFFVCF